MDNKIKIKGAKVHNLKNISLDLPKNKLIVFTGLSGSGKSSLAFDTIFAEGQRRYMESLSAYARQFLNQMDKPEVDSIDGLSPAISIDQKAPSHNPRSTVGTVTEIYDYFRLLYANIGIPHCPKCKEKIQGQSIAEMTDSVLNTCKNKKITVFAPVVEKQKGEHKQLLDSLIKKGFVRARINSEITRLDEVPPLDKNKKHSIDIVIDRMTANTENKSRLFESLESATNETNGLTLVQDMETEKNHLFSEHLSCPKCQISLPEISPRLFSFNSPIGACPECNGLGDIFDFDADLVILNPDSKIRHATGKIINLDNTIYGRMADKAAKTQGFSINDVFSSLSDKQKNVLLYGTTKKIEDNPYIKGSDDMPETAGWEGILMNLRRRYFQTQSEGMRFFFRSYMSAKTCTVCSGSRLRPVARNVLLNNHSIGDLTHKSIHELQVYFKTLKLSERETHIAKQMLKEIEERLSFLKNVGLDYLTLARKAGTLSGGEYQRIRLATQIGAGLTGVLYVLDEPSIGLHQRDNLRLIETLNHLKNLGNTLIVVEHDEDTMRKADHIVDIGPGAGNHGGAILFSGTYDELLKSKTSKTAAYLNGTKKIEIPQKRRRHKEQQYLTVTGAKENNLKNITVKFPLGQLVCVTGVSGSGKSTLVYDIIHKALTRHFNKSKERPGKHTSILGLEHLDKMITIDQSPIGRTPRSNPATYTNLFTPIRELFAQTNEAKIRGYKAGRFSFNVKGGRCEACEGDGLVKIEMHFLSDVYVTCEICKGKRYNPETLEVTYKHKTIADVLEMTVNDGLSLFENIPPIATKLKTLVDVGLGYIHMGQNATTLSGGEAQRIKLAKELSKRQTGKTLYLLDEPTTGLHFADIEHLLGVLNKLVNSGNSMIIIEHNLDVIKTADHIIDIGPEGGNGGGQVIAQGTPEKIANVKKSYTGQFLSPLLNQK